MLTRGLFLPKDDYRDLVSPSIEWGFEKIFDGRIGKNTLREALEEASFIARGDSHKVIMEEFTTFLGRVTLDDKPDWYLHTFREVVVSLMANPSCVDGSVELKKALKQVNAVQRSRA